MEAVSPPLDPSQKELLKSVVKLYFGDVEMRNKSGEVDLKGPLKTVSDAIEAEEMSACRVPQKELRWTRDNSCNWSEVPLGLAPGVEPAMYNIGIDYPLSRKRKFE